MISTKKLNKNIRIIENVVFVFAFGFIIYGLVSSYWVYVHDSIGGKGYLGAIVNPIYKHQYYKTVTAVIIILNSTCILWELLVFSIGLSKQQGVNARGLDRYKLIFKKVSANYKPSFLAFFMMHQILPKLFLIHLFWIWLPHIQKISLFTVNLQWYSWLYAILCWEFASWIFHFTSHRVRFLWCLHSPHHAPAELNMTVNWVHFFAESYYSTFIHLLISLLLGVNPLMLLAILTTDSAWAAFVHISEGTLRNGRLGIFRHFIITPSHHRVHHAKNPLYIDTNFAFIFPIWDWVFGTLQPLKDEVKIEYGIIRDLDVTNFTDLYFGEIALLYLDIKNAKGIKNKLLYFVMPPGWTPAGAAHTALAIRRDFLKTNPELGATSRGRLLAAIKDRRKSKTPEITFDEIFEPFAAEVEL